MKIKKITDNYYRIIADEKFSLRMTLDEAHELNFGIIIVMKKIIFRCGDKDDSDI